MRVQLIADTRYLLKTGAVTPKLRGIVDNVLSQYVEAARFLANLRTRHLDDYIVREAYIVGSIVRGVDDSDLDLLFLADKIDQDDYRVTKQVLSMLFFNNIPKPLAVDIYVRPHDEFPEKPSFEITKQVKDLIDKHNRDLMVPR